MSAESKKVLSAAGIVILGPLGLILVLFVIPDAVGIEWFCLFDESTREADRYAAGEAIMTATTWIALVVGTIRAHKAGRTSLGAALPPVWFTLTVGASLVLAASIGSQPCEGDSGFVF